MKRSLLRHHQQLTRDEWLRVVAYYKTHTARECAEHFGLEFKQALVTALAREHDKSAGHGGARTGSGNLDAENRKARALANIVRQARTLSALHTLPAPDDITADNYRQKATETANVLRATIAGLKQQISEIEKI